MVGITSSRQRRRESWLLNPFFGEAYGPFVEPGWGASGRNNGQVIPGFKWDPDELKLLLGEADGEHLAAFGCNAPDAVFDIIAKHRIDCSPVRHGWIQPASTRAGVHKIQLRHAQWAQRGAPVQMLDPQKLPDLLGTPFFQAGWIDYCGGSINPLAYARGLAQAARALDAAVYVKTQAHSIERESTAWVVRCAGQAPEGSTRHHGDGRLLPTARCRVCDRSARQKPGPLPNRQQTHPPSRVKIPDEER